MSDTYTMRGLPLGTREEETINHSPRTARDGLSTKRTKKEDLVARVQCDTAATDRIGPLPARVCVTRCLGGGIPTAVVALFPNATELTRQAV